MSDRIAIGGYRTQIRGVHIDTFGLGGDSRIVIRAGKAALDSRRVEPLCVAAVKHPEIMEKLRNLVESERTHSYPLHEFLYLVKEPKDITAYCAAEQSLIQMLKDGPVMIGEGRLDIYSLKTERLEQEEIIMRCGLTPTDIMHIRGDFCKFCKEASVLGARYVMANLPEGGEMDLSAFCQQVYDLVCRKLYENILKILAVDAYPRIFADGMDRQMEALIHQSCNGQTREGLFGLDFRVDAELIGIGAPIHVFLPRVAEMLGVKCIIPPHAEVANAIGAITADVQVQYQIRLCPSRELDQEGYTVFTPEGQRYCESFDNAVELAKAVAETTARRKAEGRGAMGELKVELSVHSDVARDRNGTEIELDTTVTATASGRIYG